MPPYATVGSLLAKGASTVSRGLTSERLSFFWGMLVATLSGICPLGEGRCAAPVQYKQMNRMPDAAAA